MPAWSFCPLCATPLVDRVDAGLTRRACPSCSFVHYGNPVPVVGAIVEDGSDVILVRSKGWPETWFGLVTGFLEREEDPAEGILREVKEELGLDGSLVGLVGVYSFQRMNQVIIAYHVKASGDVVLCDELAAYKRVPKDKLRPWESGTGQAVADWLAKQ